MTKDEALDLALEALEESHPEAYRHVITAIKQARALDKKADNARELGLDYEPVREPVVFYRCDGCGHAYEEQHPTSCDCMEGGGFKRVDYYTTPPAAQQDIQRLSALVRAQQITIDKLEAQRQFVGLTAGERDALFTEHYQWDAYGKAIEAKLKEKNGM